MRVLLSRWFLTLVGTLLLAALVWFFGPLLAAFEGVVVRVVVIVAMLAIWAVVNWLLWRRRRKRDAALTAGVTEGAALGPVDQTATASAEEAAALRDKLSTALGLLKKASGARGYLYEQPWYVIIGPPGAGKTTALLNAGLRFPLAAEMGQGAVAGVGGTRLCEWWFAEDAVLIDTAGRYTTQDSDAAVDRAGWDSFLDLLKRTRPRQPLNGVLVAIALSEIAQASADERLAHARAVRRRLKELEEKLGVRLPVYALFTKADLVAGFQEFFDDLDQEKRAQVWGATFSLAPPNGDAAGLFDGEFKQLVERLDARLYERLQAERSPDRRALIAGFAPQVASLEKPLAGFLAEAFGGSRLDAAPMLRGFYFASGTQEGTPIDRLTGAMARAFGLDQKRLPSLRPEKGRAYFLSRLIREVILGEAMLVSDRPGSNRRRMIFRIAGFAAAGLAAVVIGLLLWSDSGAQQRSIDDTARALSGYEQTATGLPLAPVADADLPRLAPLLDQARALPHGVDDPNATGSWFGFGLSQDAKLAAGARTVYRHALENALLPRLIWRLEAQMRGNIARPDYLYEATRVYLMLGGEGPLDRELVRTWMALDWQQAFPGVGAAPLRVSLVRHLDALMAEPLPAVPLDGELVAQARATFSRVTVAQRVYSRIKPSAAAAAVPPWRPIDALGAAGARVFTRASGKPLSEGISGFFTVAGFHTVLLPSLSPAAREVASESWVLGKKSELRPDGAEMRTLEHDVVALYTTEYAEAWNAMLTDLNVVPLRSLSQAAQDLYILASPQSPMRDVLASAARQLTLSQPPPPAPGVAGAVQGAVAGAVKSAEAAGAGAQSRLSAVLGAPGEVAGPLPGSDIDVQFKPLRDLVGGGPGAPIDAVIKLLNDMQQQLAKLAAAPIGGGGAPVLTGDDPALALRAEAQRQPQPLARWLQAMASSGTALRGGGARQQIAAAFNGSSGPAALCPLAVNGRYPFTPGSSNDVPIDDFSKLFAPGGLMDGFLNTQLKPYVDMTQKTWAPRTADGVPAPVTPADLAQFQRAAVIRDLFFAGGASTPTVRFDLTPTNLDSGATQATLDLDGTTIAYAHGPPRSTQITWPGPNRMQNVRLVIEPPPTGGTGVLNETGPWALFRLFGKGVLKQAGSSDKYTLTFRLGDRQVDYEIRAGSVLNPLAPGVLQEFHCPIVQ